MLALGNSVRLVSKEKLAFRNKYPSRKINIRLYVRKINNQNVTSLKIRTILKTALPQNSLFQRR